MVLIWWTGGTTVDCTVAGGGTGAGMVTGGLTSVLIRLVVAHAFVRRRVCQHHLELDPVHLHPMQSSDGCLSGRPYCELGVAVVLAAY